MATHSSSRLADWRAERKRRQEARIAELEQHDREAAERLHNIKPPPLFSEAAVDGACPKCHGRNFRSDTVKTVLGGLLVGGVVGAAAATAAATSDVRLECVTCGERFRKG